MSLVEKLRSAFETSLFYNHVIAVFSIVLLIAAVAELPIAAGVKLQLVPIVASIIPYIWSFTRAANVGVNGGILGVVFGLFWFAWREPNINWWDQAPFFFVLTVVANFSGWLGGWVGGGQTREATAAMIIKIRIGDQGINLPNLIQAVKEKIECKLSEIRPAKRPGLTDHEFHLTLAEGSPSAIVSFKHEIEGWTDKSWLRF